MDFLEYAFGGAKELGLAYFQSEQAREEAAQRATSDAAIAQATAAAAADKRSERNAQIQFLVLAGVATMFGVIMLRSMTRK
jgi:hypothetical protein